MADPTPGLADPTVARVEAATVVEQLSEAQSQAVSEADAPPKTDEQALESHEVIELQTFSERKSWIEAKIKFLESLPPVEVFVGLDAIRASAEDVPGLPTRAELDKWMEEHDAIEKETEIFDTGELTKLRQLTKAATQRNLSPEDTDVIELTLTTIYTLDKLLHLLRDRSDNLEMMSIRLTWEEHRRNSWRERRQIIEDLEAFSSSRARWNVNIYDMIPQETQSTPLGSRRGSVASLASVASDNPIPAFSRSARFKLAELLSRDAAQFTGKVTSLRHGKVAAAGKALDKLIDHSRKPVPEELLDEQDRLEEKCINELKSIGNFTMHLVMQWRKADEIYVETMKDFTAASNLLEEIEMAKLHHPIARQSTAFTSRIDTILKRLAVRLDPASPSSMFPRPEHFLFPEQKNANDILISKLSADIRNANQLARKVDLLAKDYRMTYEAVKQAETMMQSMTELSAKMGDLVNQFNEGKPGADIDGMPPDLTSARCLDPSAHTTFMAFWPSLLKDTEEAIGKADQLIAKAPSIILGLSIGTIDKEFKESATTHVDDLARSKKELSDTRDTVIRQVERLRESRRILLNIESKNASVEAIKFQLIDCVKEARWQQESGNTGLPLTPESPTTPLARSTDHDSTTFETQLSKINNEVMQDIQDPLQALFRNLEAPLQAHLNDKATLLKESLDVGHKLLLLLEDVKRQSAGMKSVRDEFHAIVTEIEDAKVDIADAVQRILQGDVVDPNSHKPIDKYDIGPIQEKVDRFTNSLSTRVSFVARHSVPSSNGNGAIQHKAKSPYRSEFEKFAGLPFELTSLDSAVRADSNFYAMRLNGDIEVLKKAHQKLELAVMANAVDHDLSSITKETAKLVQELESKKATIAAISYEDDNAMTCLQEALDGLKGLRERRSQILRSMSPVRGRLREMDELSGSLDSSSRAEMYKSRNAETDKAEVLLKKCNEDFDLFEKEVSQVLQQASKYQEELKAADERRKREEELRLAEEEAERIRLEKEKRDEEERQRLLEIRLAEEQRQREEQERKALEEAEKERLAKEAAELERLRVEKLKAEAEEKRKLEEEQRKAEEDATRARLEREKMEAEEKLRATEALLEEQRRLAAEQEREAAETLRKQKIEAEERVKAQRMEMQRLADEHALALANEAAKKEKQLNEDRKKVTGNRERSASKHSAAINVADLFGPQATPSTSDSKASEDLIQLQAQLLALRKRLRSLVANGTFRQSKSSTTLPNEEQYTQLHRDITTISEDLQKLPSVVENASIKAEIASLKSEIDEAFASLSKFRLLVDINDATKACDAALSDLLEHIDSYPAIPLSILASSHRSSVSDTPEEQLSARLQFTRGFVDELATKSEGTEDRRVESEYTRIQQTWQELEEMALDRINGNRSRPTSAVSRISSRSSISHISHIMPAVPTHRGTRKKGSYSNLSVSSIQSVPTRSKMLAPPAPIQPKTRRAASGSAQTADRSTSRISSTSSTRSVSGPLNSSLYGSTFASRQRTTSLTAAPVITPSRQSLSGSRSRLTSETKRSKSPESERPSSRSRSSLAPPRTVSNSSSWSRAPRDSFPAMMPRIVTPTLKKTEPPVRKKYVANPKSKLDVAVGDVVNQLPVGINIEGITESWRDQSGKYWIGNQDPKLCFCRILRSQTVMVRVGGGWTELSKFIKEHFADSFRIAPLPDSPPRQREEKWISSSTLLEARAQTPPRAPQTPEPTVPFLPSFSLMTPSGQSPRSMGSSPSAKGSPLTPLQFMRRAEPEYPSGILRPVTPSKPPRGRISNANTPSAPRTSVWRP
ncbi:hypothetical protein CPC08DRAFT_705858 [Agrocybe pediades]|nr:hypothetical protein CPC08DRAFT_705858 [Agrocybe pediades]